MLIQAKMNSAAYNLQTGNYQDAVNEYGFVISAVPENPENTEVLRIAYSNRGLAYLNMGHFSSAVSDFDKSLSFESHPFAAMTLGNRGSAYHKLNNIQAAIADFTGAIEAGTTNPGCYGDLGNLQSEMGQCEDAIKNFDIAIKLAKNYGPAYFGRGVAKCKLAIQASSSTLSAQLLEDARQDVEKSIVLAPGRHESYQQLGEIFISLKRPDKALDAYNNAIEKAQIANSNNNNSITVNEKLAEYYNKRGLIKYYDLKLTDDAIADLKQAVKLNPKIKETCAHLADIYLILEKNDEALEFADKAVIIEPNDPRPYYYRALANIKLKKFKEALEDCNVSIAKNNKNADVYHHRGLLQRDVFGNYKAAIDDLQISISLNPQNQASKTALIEAQSRLTRQLAQEILDGAEVKSADGRIQEAIDDTTKAIQQLPESSENASKLAYAYAVRGKSKANLKEFKIAVEDYNTAEAILKKYNLLKIDDSSKVIYGSRGLLYLLLEECQKAKDDLEKAITIYGNVKDENLAEYYVNLARVKEKLGLIADAKKDFNTGIEMNPKSGYGYYRRGLLYRDLGELETALSDFSQAIELGINAECYYNFAHTRYSIGLNKKDNNLLVEAIKDFDEAIKQDPKFSEAFLMRGKIKHDLKRLEDAAGDYRQAISFNPAFKIAYFNLAYAYFDLANFQESLQTFNQLIALDLNDKSAFAGRGMARYELGDFDGALEDFNIAIEHNQAGASVYRARGLVLCNHKKDRRAALEDFKMAVKLNPTNLQCQTYVKQLEEFLRLNSSVVTNTASMSVQSNNLHANAQLDNNSSRISTQTLANVSSVSIAPKSAYFSLSDEKEFLIAASNDKHFDKLVGLLEKGVPVDAKNQVGSTALKIAVANKAKKNIEFLLKHGATRKIADGFCESPLGLAKQDPEIMEIFDRIPEKNISLQPS